jgi:PAS domain S-box-containing protein
MFMMMKRGPARDLLAIVVLTAIYFVVGYLCLKLAYLNAHASPVWPPTGLAMGAVLLLGYRASPAIFAGAYLVNWATDASPTVATILALGNTLEAVLGAALARRFAGGASFPDRAADIFRFAFFAAIPSTIVSAGIGVLALGLPQQSGLIHTSHVFATWWTGDLTGALIVAPTLLVWFGNPLPKLSRKRAIEASILLLLVVLTTQIRYGGFVSSRIQSLPTGVLLVPLLTWGAFRFHQHGAVTVGALISAAAVAGTLAGFGSFAQLEINDRLIALQIYLAVVTLTSFVLAAAVAQHTSAETALRRNEEHLRIALEGGKMGTWHWDIASDSVVASPALEEIRGLEPGTFAGTFEAFLADIHPDDQATVQAHLAEAVEKRRDHHIEYRLKLRGTGETRWVEARGRPVLDGRGTPTGMVGICMDVTARRRAQEERDEILARERAARAEAERASKAKDQFLAVLSHELRTPLTPVMLTASMLEKDPSLPQQARDELRTIRQNVELEARLIDDLLDLTRIARAKLQIQFQTIDLHAVIRRAIGSLSASAAEPASPPITAHLVAKRHFVRADPARIQQVFLNLLTNAAKFTPATGSIVIRTSNRTPSDDDLVGVAKDTIVVEVIDSGAGIEPDLLPKLFNAFEQGAAVKERKIGGLGLGLAISKALVTAHQGSLTAHSDGPGKGSMFVVQLPAVAGVAEPSDDGSHRPDAPSTPAARQKQPLKILLVEDHESTRRVMRRLLTARSHDVTTASCVAEAIQAADGQRFDLIISDLGLPDGMGYDIMNRVRQRYGTCGIAISGYGMDADIERSRNAGFIEHLTKPVDMPTLEAAITRAAATIASGANGNA